MNGVKTADNLVRERELIRLRRQVMHRDVVRWMEGSEVTGYVYFIQGGKYVKIGYTENPDISKRLGELQTGCPFPLKVIGSIPANRSLEWYLHRIYRQWRTHGEWFRISAPGLRQIIARSNEALFI